MYLLSYVCYMFFVFLCSDGAREYCPAGDLFGPRRKSRGTRAGSVVRETEHGHESRLGDFDPADLPHALFALFLFFEQLAFAGDVASVALGGNVLADSLDRFAGDDLGADGRLERNVELLAGIRPRSFSTIFLPMLYALARCTSEESASTGSPLIRISTLTRSAWRKSMGV